MKFSERDGVGGEPGMQRRQISGRLRNRLWNVISDLVQRIDVEMTPGMNKLLTGTFSPGHALLEQVWVDFEGGIRDEFGYDEPPLDQVKTWFLELQWYRVYDLIEFIAATLKSADRFEQECNNALAKEVAAYRLVKAKVIELVDESQLAAITAAVEIATDVPGVHAHLRTALARVADRTAPDYRNAMKEAISAVEALAKQMVGSKGTLAEALGEFKGRGIELHPAMVKAWSAIYGYASDEVGVRHGSADASPVGLAEALNMIVSCSAFVSYLMDLARRSNIELRAK